MISILKKPSDLVTAEDRGRKFAEFGDNRKYLIDSMSGEEFKSLIDSFTENVPLKDRQVMHITLSKQNYLSYTEKLKSIEDLGAEQNRLGNLLSNGDKSSVKFLLSLDKVTESNKDGKFKDFKKIILEHKFVSGVDVVPSLPEHWTTERSMFDNNTAKHFELLKTMIEDDALNNADIRFHAFEGDNKNKAFYTQLWTFLEENKDRLKKRNGKIRIGHSGSLDKGEIQKLKKLQLDDKLLVEFNPNTYIELGDNSSDKRNKILNTLVGLLENDLKVVFGSDSFGIYTTTCNSKTICRSSFSQNISEYAADSRLNKSIKIDGQDVSLRQLLFQNFIDSGLSEDTLTNAFDILKEKDVEGHSKLLNDLKIKNFPCPIVPYVGN